MMWKPESMIDQHFVERTWVDLFSKVLTENEIAQLNIFTNKFHTGHSSIYG